MDEELLIRFVNRKPSVFQVLDDDVGVLDAMALELQPGPRDNGWASYWARANLLEEDRILAAFAARRQSKQTLDAVVLPTGLLAELGIVVKADTDAETFQCVADLHRLVGLNDEQARRRLAEVILSRFQGSQDFRARFWRRVTKGALRDLFLAVLGSCTDSPDRTRAAQWLQEEL